MQKRLIALLGLAALATAILLSPALGQSARLDGFGVVLMHGKLFGPGAYVGDLIAELRAEGAEVETPEMPWSRARMYDATYEQAMGEIDAAVARLKARGTKKIVIAGHSMDANGAIGYGARRGGLAAVIALAPGHLPETPEMREYTKSAIARAKEFVAAGRGNERMSFPDRAQGWPYFVSATPRVYLSLFDPAGPAVMPKNSAAMPTVPFLWVVGRSDPIHPRGPGYAYQLGAKHPKSRYLVVDSGHLHAPNAARKEIVAWLKSL